MDDNRREELKKFIRDNRNSEGNFDMLKKKLDEELSNAEGNIQYHTSLEEIKKKQVEEYTIAIQKGEVHGRSLKILYLLLKNL